MPSIEHSVDSVLEMNQLAVSVLHDAIARYSLRYEQHDRFSIARSSDTLADARQQVYDMYAFSSGYTRNVRSIIDQQLDEPKTVLGQGVTATALCLREHLHEVIESPVGSDDNAIHLSTLLDEFHKRVLVRNAHNMGEFQHALDSKRLTESEAVRSAVRLARHVGKCVTLPIVDVSSTLFDAALSDGQAGLSSPDALTYFAHNFRSAIAAISV